MKRITIIMMLLTVATYVFSSVGSTPPPEGSADERIILTPPPPHEPRVNCAKVFGLRPGSECRFLVATSGDRPMTFSAKGLPKGLYINKETGLVSGRTSRRGEYAVVMTATNALGSDQRTVRFKVGDEIALTPPMGWNSWNCWGKTVSQERVMASARAMRDKDSSTTDGPTSTLMTDGRAFAAAGTMPFSLTRSFPTSRGWPTAYTIWV